MFLQKVYRHNKWLFAGMLFFMLGQIAINSKRGMVFSPWYHYGMFSATIAVQDTYHVQLIGGADKLPWAPQAWDKVYVTLARYQSLDTNQNLYHNEISRLLPKAGLKVPAIEHYTSSVSESEFLIWYHQYLARYQFDKQKESALLQAKAIWNGNELKMIESP